MCYFDKYKDVPEAMKVCDNWVDWKPYEMFTKRINKVALNEDGSISKRSLIYNKIDFSSYDKAMQRLAQEKNSELGLGFGFRFSDNIIGIDLDHVASGFLSCRTENERLVYSLFDIAKIHGCYVETSFSGKGYHIYGLCSRKVKEQLLLYNTYGVLYSFGIEIYFAGSYLTVSGNMVNRGWNNIDNVVENALEVIDKINASLGNFNFSFEI